MSFSQQSSDEGNHTMKHLLEALSLSFLLLFLVACQPPPHSTSSDAGEGAHGASQGSAATSQWMPRVVAIEGTCDASLYVQTGPLTSRLRVDAAAGHDHAGENAGATVAVETPLGSYRCTYRRGAESGCEDAPPVVVQPPVVEPADDSADDPAADLDSESESAEE